MAFCRRMMCRKAHFPTICGQTGAACINVRTEEAYETAHEVLRAEGLFLGTSAAAALHAAVQVGRRPENQGKNIVVIVPDNGMKYLSTPMYRQK